MLLPMKPGGVEHQHFNADPAKPAIWAAFINIPIQEYLASDLQQAESSRRTSRSERAVRGESMRTP